VSAAGALVYAVSTLAIAADDQFVFSDDRSSVKVEVRDMPLGEVLHRLLDNIPAHTQWGDPALEKQPTTGKFSGGGCGCFFARNPERKVRCPNCDQPGAKHSESDRQTGQPAFASGEQAFEAVSAQLDPNEIGAIVLRQCSGNMRRTNCTMRD
jgi:hypothetical protein